MVEADFSWTNPDSYLGPYPQIICNYQRKRIHDIGIRHSQLLVRLEARGLNHEK